MITDIVPYIGSYDDVRAVCGLNDLELPDTTLALSLYRNRLNLVLSNVAGVYPPSTDSENLETVFERLDSEDEMYIAIQQLAIYSVSDAVLDSVGLRAYKTQADGKSNLTRFSAESTYLRTCKVVKENISQARTSIAALFDEAEESLDYLVTVVPDVDLVTGE